MQLARWNPLRELDAFFHNYQRSLGAGSWAGLENEWSPSVDITENDAEFLIKAEVPEVKKEDIRIQVDHGVLTLSGERKQERTNEKEHRMERFYGSFTRSFTLPTNVDEDAIRAEFRDGMLYLTLPKTTVTKPVPHEITIN